MSEQQHQNDSGPLWPEVKPQERTPEEVSRYIRGPDGKFETSEEKQQVFVRWLALPKDQREPSTQGELARDVLGVDPSTLYRWKQKEHIQKQIRRRRLVGLADYDQQVFEALVKTASTPGKKGAKDRDLFFKLRGYDVDKLKIEQTVEHKASEATDEELVRMVVDDIADQLAEALGVERGMVMEIAEQKAAGQLEPAKKHDRAAVDADFEVMEYETEQPEAPETSDDEKGPSNPGRDMSDLDDLDELGW